MRQTYLEFCDLRARNFSGESIPGFACMQVCGYSSNAAGEAEFLVKKPDGKGKLFLINSPFEIPVTGDDGTPGVGDATNHYGAFVLFDGEPPSFSTDNPLVEWGPKAGSWAIDKNGKGFVIVGQEAGAAGSEPGWPPVASTKRVRVAMVSVSEVPNRIQGTCAQSTSPTTLEFLIQDIFVLSGVDPRPEPHFPSQTVRVQNNLKKTYVNGIDRITATQNKSDLKWYVETDPGGGGAVIYGTLRTDLTTQMPSVVVQVNFFSGENPADNTGAVACWNPTDFIRPGLQQGETRYLFCGNAGGQVTAAKMTDGKWYLVSVQPPIKPPIKPEA